MIFLAAIITALAIDRSRGISYAKGRARKPSRRRRPRKPTRGKWPHIIPKRVKAP